MKILLTILILLTMNSENVKAQRQSSVRQMAVAGQFYPAEKKTLEAIVKGYFDESSEIDTLDSIVAVIVPHAGYVFSGLAAAKAYSAIPSDKKFNNIFLIGPSHHIFLEGASVNTGFDYYETPLGNVKVDKELCQELIDGNDCFTYRPDAHDKEHCLEVQLPFLQVRLKDMPEIVPIIIGTQKYSIVKAVATALKPYLNQDNLFVISSDFSHYPAYDDARKADIRTANAISSGDPVVFVKALQENYQEHIPNLQTSACGQSAIMAIMLMTQNGGKFSYNHLFYNNSGDSRYGGKDEVVGYNAFAVTEEKQSGFTITDEEKKTLLRIARSSIEGAFTGQSLQDSWKGLELTTLLQSKCGAFVTLNENNRLRGCIGHFGEDEPVYRVVAQMARAAAFDDPRFNEVSEEEMERIAIEISVLSPLKRINGAAEFNYGKEGIYMVKNGRSGTFLPQVAEETGWSKEEFLSHCAQDKAGIGPDGWKTADLYTYEAAVFNEPDAKKQ